MLAGNGLDSRARDILKLVFVVMSLVFIFLLNFYCQFMLRTGSATFFNTNCYAFAHMDPFDISCFMRVKGSNFLSD